MNITTPDSFIVTPDCQGKIPIGMVAGYTLAEATYNAWKLCFNHGVRVKNVKHDPESPYAHDMSLLVVVKNPCAEPMIFTPALCADDVSLEAYRLEVVAGIHDHWVPRGYWDYTYHERISPQIEPIMRKIENTWLEKGRITSRDFQFTTWRWQVDTEIDDPPCLQIVHLRFLPTENDNEYMLNMQVVFRSRDLGNGFWMNAYAFISWQKYFVRMVNARLEKYGITIRVGQYADFSISKHLYGRDEITRNLIKTIARMQKQPWTRFAMDSGDYLPLDRKKQIRRLIAAQLDFDQRHFGREDHQYNAPPDTLIEAGYNLDTFSYPEEWDLD